MSVEVVAKVPRRFWWIITWRRLIVGWWIIGWWSAARGVLRAVHRIAPLTTASEDFSTGTTTNAALSIFSVATGTIHQSPSSLRLSHHNIKNVKSSSILRYPSTVAKPHPKLPLDITLICSRNATGDRVPDFIHKYSHHHQY